MAVIWIDERLEEAWGIVTPKLTLFYLSYAEFFLEVSVSTVHSIVPAQL
jgi:hypothetical protein